MKRLFLVLLALVMVFAFMGCSFVQINPSIESENYNTFGRDLGTYLKSKRPELVLKVKPHVDVALAMSDKELLEKNVLQTAYEYAMETYPDDADLIFVIKSGINLLGIKIDASQLTPDELPGYAKCIRAVLKGFSDVTKDALFQAKEKPIIHIK